MLSLTKCQGARWNGPPSHPSLLKVRVEAAMCSTPLEMRVAPSLGYNDRISNKRELNNCFIVGGKRMFQ